MCSSLTLGTPFTPAITIHKLKYFINALKDIAIAPGNYSACDLNAAIVAKINAACNVGEIFVIDYVVKSNSMGIKFKNDLPGVTFKICTESVTLQIQRKEAGA